MDNTTADRRLEKLEKNRKIMVRNSLITQVGLGISLAYMVFLVWDFSDKAQHLEDRIGDTSHYTGVDGLSVEWGRRSEETTSGGLRFGAVSNKEECLEIYSWSIYGFDPPAYSRNVIEDAKSRVLLLDFLPSPVLLGKVKFSTRWYVYEDQEFFVLEPGHADLPGGMVWFNRGEQVYIGTRPDSFAQKAAWAATHPKAKAPVVGKSSRIFAMPKEGVWTFSIEDGLVRVED
jgi:hypothetical protein